MTTADPERAVRSLVRSLSARPLPVLGDVRPGEDDAAGSVRQLQRAGGERQRVRPGRPSRHGAGLRHVPVPVPLLRAPSFPVLAQHQCQEQPPSQRVPPVADRTLGRGEAAGCCLSDVFSPCSWRGFLVLLVWCSMLKHASTSLITMRGY